ncbi:MAG TPA: hypothetical protein VKU82_10190 [Planctomycetaceae bacterium]|nr:hypothetical protein [Planctomycetaceae bacterium]
MHESAHVTSIDAIVRFGSALRTFEDDASRSLVALEEQAKGALEWLEHDAPAYWRAQVKLCFDHVARTRTALETCRMRTVAGNRPACLEELEAYRAAKRRLRQAEEKIETVRHWVQRVRREIDEYRGRIMGLGRCLDSDVPRTIALIESTVGALDSYIDRPDAAEEP